MKMKMKMKMIRLSSVIAGLKGAYISNLGRESPYASVEKHIRWAYAIVLSFSIKYRRRKLGTQHPFKIA